MSATPHVDSAYPSRPVRPASSPSPNKLEPPYPLQITSLRLTGGRSLGLLHCDRGDGNLEYMAATTVSTQIHALLERPSPSKSEESTLTYLNAHFSSLQGLERGHGLLTAVEQAEQQDQELTDRVRTSDAVLETVC